MKTEYPLDKEIRNSFLVYPFLIIGLREVFNLIYFFVGYTRPSIGIDLLYLLMLLIFISSIHLILCAYTEKIIVSSEGLTFQRIGFSGFIQWKDFERIGFRRNFRVAYEGMFAPRRKAIFSGFESFFGVYGKEVFVSLHRYSKNWRDAELGRQIKQYAPHLFQ
jgi:hypothetical protein